MTSAPSFTVAELADRVGGDLRGRGDREITGVGSLDASGPRDITFISDASHAGRWAASEAAAALVSAGVETEPGADRAIIVVDDAPRALIDVLRLFEPAAALPDAGVHPSAVVHKEATLGEGARIGPLASVGAGAVLGDRVVLHAGARVYAGASIGDDSIVHANAVVRERCRLGRRVVLYQGAAVGADGFGFLPAPSGTGVLKVPHIGDVVLEDDVEVGANACIDRAKFGSTVIGAGTKIDNLVQIGHNCRIGRGCVIAALSGIGGSVIIGDVTRIGGQVGIADHVRVGSRVSIGAQSGLMKDIPDGQTVLGSPASDIRERLRQLAAIRRLPELLRERDRPFKADLG